MWRRKPKFKELDQLQVDRLTYKLPGIDNSKIIPADGIKGKLYFWGFVPDKYQPKPIATIIAEQLIEKERASRNQS